MFYNMENAELKYINKTLETTHQICKIGAEQFQKDRGPFR